MKTERLSVVFGDPGTKECDSAAAELQCLLAHPDPKRLGGIAVRDCQIGRALQAAGVVAYFALVVGRGLVLQIHELTDRQRFECRNCI